MNTKLINQKFSLNIKDYLFLLNDKNKRVCIVLESFENISWNELECIFTFFINNGVKLISLIGKDSQLVEKKLDELIVTKGFGGNIITINEINLNDIETELSIFHTMDIGISNDIEIYLYDYLYTDKLIKYISNLKLKI